MLIIGREYFSFSFDEHVYCRIIFQRLLTKSAMRSLKDSPNSERIAIAWSTAGHFRPYTKR